MYMAHSIVKYLQDNNYEDTNNFRLALVEGKCVLSEWGYDIEPPDLSMFNEEATRVNFGLAAVRKIRNDILEMTDKFVLLDSPMPETTRHVILIPYRRALRDITSGIRNGTIPTPELNDNMKVVNLRNIFPTIPSTPGNYLKPIQARYRWMDYEGDVNGSK